MFINRIYKDKLKKSLKNFPVLYISGARQVGKTSLLKMMLGSYEYVSMDDIASASFAQSNPKEFLEQFKGKNVIIDEIQYTPDLFRHIKVVVDSHKKPGQFVLTGSQHFLLMKGIQESLAGRCAIISMFPLTFQELLKPGLTDGQHYLNLIFTGGYPELWAQPDIDKKTWFGSYIASYIERDVRNSLNITSLRDFERFLRAVAFRTGQLLSLSDIARDVGIAVSTVKAWLSVLEASKQIQLVEPYYRNIGKRLVKSPKLFFGDTGIACYLNGIRTIEQLRESPLLGNLWETYIFNQLAAMLSISSEDTLWFWRTSTGQEVDFVIDNGGNYQLIEVKLGERIHKSDLKNMEFFESSYGKNNIQSKTVICTTPKRYMINDVAIEPFTRVVSI